MVILDAFKKYVGSLLNAQVFTLVCVLLLSGESLYGAAGETSRGRGWFGRGGRDLQVQVTQLQAELVRVSAEKEELQQMFEQEQQERCSHENSMQLLVQTMGDLQKILSEIQESEKGALREELRGAFETVRDQLSRIQLEAGNKTAREYSAMEDRLRREYLEKNQGIQRKVMHLEGRENRLQEGERELEAARAAMKEAERAAEGSASMLLSDLKERVVKKPVGEDAEGQSAVIVDEILEAWAAKKAATAPVSVKPRALGEPFTVTVAEMKRLAGKMVRMQEEISTLQAVNNQLKQTGSNCDQLLGQKTRDWDRLEKMLEQLREENSAQKVQLQDQKKLLGECLEFAQEREDLESKLEAEAQVPAQYLEMIRALRDTVMVQKERITALEQKKSRSEVKQPATARQARQKPSRIPTLHGGFKQSGAVTARSYGE